MRHISLNICLAVLAIAIRASLPFHDAVHASVYRKADRVHFRGHQVIALGPKGERIWKWTAANPVTDAMVGWQGYVYVTTLDGHIVALGWRGRKVWSHFLNGSGQYVQIERYGADGFAVKIDTSAYRERLNDEGIPDKVQIFRRHEFVKSVEFPAKGRLEVSGSSLYAKFHRLGRPRRWRVL